MNKNTIDQIDQSIINLLQKDGRLGAAEIARRIGDVTERQVRYRIERMVNEDIVQISAIVNPEAVGYKVIADVWVEVEAGLVMDVARELKELDQVAYIACSTGGDRDISMQVYERDNVELYTFVTEVIGKIKGVKKTSMLIVPMVIKDIHHWKIPDSACSDPKSGL